MAQGEGLFDADESGGQNAPAEFNGAGAVLALVQPWDEEPPSPL